MIKRHLEAWLQKQIGDPHIIQIQGLRQTGKTTLMEYFRGSFPHSLNYPIQNLNVFQRYHAEPERWVLEIEQELAKWKKTGKTPLHIFVDEIQKIPLLYQGIQGLYDAHKGDLKFWIWGSSARPIKRQKAETLAGRVFTKILWPFSQSEISGKESIVPYLVSPEKLMDYSRSESFDDPARLMKALTQSLLPEPYLEEEREKAELILESYQNTYLENEIRRENLVANMGIFEKFLTLAASEDTQIANYTAKAKVLGVAPLTVQNYYNMLEDTFVCLRLPAYSGSFRVQVSKSPKIYFTDPALARFVSGARGQLHPHTTPFGQAFEGFVLVEIMKQVEYRNLPWRLFYFRTKTGVEVDVVIQTPDETIACEIKATKKVDAGDYRDVQKLMRIDSKIRRGIVFSQDPRSGEIAPGIYNVPVWNL